MLGPSALSAAKNCGEEQRVREGHERTPHHTEHRLGTKLFVMILVNLLGWWWWQVPASWMCRYVRYKHTHTTLPTKRSPRESIEHRLVGGKPVDVDGQVVISSHSASAAVYDSSHQRASLPSLLVDEQDLVNIQHDGPLHRILATAADKLRGCLDCLRVRPISGNREIADIEGSIEGWWTAILGTKFWPSSFSTVNFRFLPCDHWKDSRLDSSTMLGCL